MFQGRKTQAAITPMIRTTATVIERGMPPGRRPSTLSAAQEANTVLTSHAAQGKILASIGPSGFSPPSGQLFAMASSSPGQILGEPIPDNNHFRR